MPDVRSIYFGNSPRLYDAENPRRNGFKATPLGYDFGHVPSCAINGNGQFIAVHRGSTSSTLNFRQGRIERLDLIFTDKRDMGSLGDGDNPSVAFSDGNVAILMADNNNKVRYAVATVDTTKQANPPFKFTDLSDNNVSDPSVALNKSGTVVAVYQTGNKGIVYRRGKLTGSNLTWAPSAAPVAATAGRHPSVSINNKGDVVVVFETDAGLQYKTGSFDPGKTGVNEPITFARSMTQYQANGQHPGVAVTDAGEVFTVHHASNKLVQMVGQLANKTITFADFLVPNRTAYVFDDGIEVDIATNGNVAMQVHYLSTGNNTLFANASLIFDRANWMNDNLGTLKDKTLRRIAIPASHDTGAFAADDAQTQDLTVRQQLRYGVRYFDIRPIYNGNAKKIDSSQIFTYHNVGAADRVFPGPPLEGVIANVRLFMQSHNELVILKISHFRQFSQAVFDALADLITGKGSNGKKGLSKWLFPPAKDNVRLADRPLSDFLKGNQGTVLVVVDVDGTNDYITAAHRDNGLYRYRDWYAPDPDKGDLTVFDVFSDSDVFDDVALNTASSKYTTPPNNKPVPRGQLNQFLWFDGLCRNNRNVQCDLFLLSWTVTPTVAHQSTRTTAFHVAPSANQGLVSYLAIPDFQGANPQGLRMNLLYTDAVEFSRSVDVALIRNGIGR